MICNIRINKVTAGIYAVTLSAAVPIWMCVRFMDPEAIDNIPRVVKAVPYLLKARVLVTKVTRMLLYGGVTRARRTHRAANNRYMVNKW